MAVSGKTAAPHEIPYYLGTDAPPDMAVVTKALADRNHALFTEQDENMQRAGVGGHIFAASVTRASSTSGSFSTPIKVVIPKVAAHQLIQVFLFSYLSAEATVEVRVNGAAVQAPLVQKASPAPGNYSNVVTSPAGLTIGVSGEVTAAYATEIAAQMQTTPSYSGCSPAYLMHPAETTPTTVELIGKVPSGTATLKAVHFMARAVG